MRKLIAILGVLSWFLVGWGFYDAQEKLNKEEALLFRFTMEDGSVVLAVPKQPFVEVLTELGTIKVPFTKLQSLDLGPRLTDAEDAKLNLILENLASADYSARESATQKLKALGPRFYFKLFGQSKDMEVKRRLEATKVLYEKEYGIALLKAAKLDTLRTPTVQASGLVTTKTIKAESKHFGIVNIEVAYLLNVQQIGSGSIFAELTISGMQSEWLDTGIEIDNRKIRIQAEGSVDLYTQTPGQYMCGPEGYNPTNNANTDLVALSRQGALIYRLGITGSPSFAGTNAHVRGSGRLYLQVVKNQWNVKSEGSYKVKITGE